MAAPALLTRRPAVAFGARRRGQERRGRPRPAVVAECRSGSNGWTNSVPSSRPSAPRRPRACGGRTGPAIPGRGGGPGRPRTANGPPAIRSTLAPAPTPGLRAEDEGVGCRATRSSGPLGCLPILVESRAPSQCSQRSVRGRSGKCRETPEEGWHGTRPSTQHAASGRMTAGDPATSPSARGRWGSHRLRCPPGRGEVPTEGRGSPEGGQNRACQRSRPPPQGQSSRRSGLPLVQGAAWVRSRENVLSPRVPPGSELAA